MLRFACPSRIKKSYIAKNKLEKKGKANLVWPRVPCSTVKHDSSDNILENSMLHKL